MLRYRFKLVGGAAILCHIMGKHFYIKTYGCQMNEYDSARLATALCKQLGMEQVETPEEAELILLNTCSVREKAQEKLFSDLGRWKFLKQVKPELVLGVGGCVAVQEGVNVRRRAPYVDIVFGPTTLHKLPELYTQVLEQRSPIVELSCNALEKFSKLPESKIEGPSAFVTIMEGCNKYCSYCIVPYTRGKELSRPMTEVRAEVESLVAQGVKEICFLGQNVNDYRDGANDLAELIFASAKIPEIVRLSFMTSYPTAITERLINSYATEPKLLNHLHLPVQSGSDRILTAMRRRYTAAEYREKIAALRAVRPELSISSDFIVGFPGETEEDFQQTLQLVKDINFDASFSFIYSPRPGTVAAKLPDNVSLAEKKQRLLTLQAQLLNQAQKYSEAMIGTTQQVLVTGYSKKSSKELCGRTENNRTVNFSAASDLIGKVVAIEITELKSNTLRGKRERRQG